MPGPLTIRSAQPEDARQWLTLWRAYCAALGGAVSDTATNGLWERILVSDHPIGCLVARNFRMELVGLANYVLHPHTWSLQPVCYLEDLYVAPEARGHGAGRFSSRASSRSGESEAGGVFTVTRTVTITRPARSTTN